MKSHLNETWSSNSTSLNSSSKFSINPFVTETTGQTSGEKQKGGRCVKTRKAVASQSPRMMCSRVPQQDDDSDSETSQDNEEDGNNCPIDFSKGKFLD